MNDVTRVMRSTQVTVQEHIAYGPVDNIGNGHYVIDANSLVELVYTQLMDMYGTGFAVRSEGPETIQAALMEQGIYVPPQIILQAIERYL